MEDVKTVTAVVEGSFIRITPVQGQKVKAIKGLEIGVEGGEAIGKLDLAVATKFPRITITQSGPLDVKLGEPVTLTATDEEGSEYIIESAEAAKPGVVTSTGAVVTPIKKGSAKLNVKLNLETSEYASLTKKPKDTVAYSAKVLDTAPKPPKPPKNSGTLSAPKGKLDVVDANSELVVFINSQDAPGKGAITDVRLDGPDSAKFKAELREDGVSFSVKAVPGAEVLPKQSYELAVYLKKAADGSEVKITKPIKFKPVQTSAKAIASRKDITLYTGIPEPGQEISLGLSSNADVKLGHAQVQKPKANTPEFELVRKGVNDWTLRFKSGATPGGSLKASYTLKLEVWPEGAFARKDDFSFDKPLPNAKASVVSIKVFVK
jgi:hypothetical protein